MKEIYEINNFVDLSNDLNKPLNKTHRIKYTCYDASCNYVVCGATSGSLYLFQRDCKFLQLIPNLNGAINNVAISPLENYIAFTTQKGNVSVYAIDLTTVQPVVISSYYREMTVTQLIWKQNECQLFLGDMKGNVFLANLNNFLGRALTNISIHPILFLDSPVVQISELEQLLLVSNCTKTILCNTDTEEFKQIGSQPRDGKFGACFLLDNYDNNDRRLQEGRIMVARPKYRIWESNLDGKVLQTHKFKSILNSKASADISGHVKNQSNDILTQKHQINEQLVHLQAINGFFLLAYNTTAFYIFDVIHSNVVMWNNSFDAIRTIKVIENDSTKNTFIIFTEDSKMFSLQLMQLDRILYDRLIKELYFDGFEFLLQHLKYFKEKSNDLTFRYYYSILLNKIASDDNDGATRLQQLHDEFDELLTKKYGKQFDEIDKMATTNGRRLSNGIYLIENSFTPNPDHQSESIKVMNMYGNVANDEALSILSSVDDDSIVHSNVKADVIQHNKNSASLLVMEPKVLSEHDKVVQNLFFIYKSLKMSNFNLVERYADIFDCYDLAGIQRLLNTLETMILENDSGISEPEVKQYCARMYLNYIKIELLDDLDSDSRDFVIDCFIQANIASNNSIQRCQSCHFPLVVEVTVLKYREMAEIIVKCLLLHEDRDRIWDIVERVPACLNIMVKGIIEDQFDTPSKSSRDDFDAIIDLLFACANQVQLEHFVKKYPSLRTFDFWRGFLTRLIRLHDEECIQCVRCGTNCAISYQKLAESKPFYAHDYVMNICADHLNGLTALRLCTNIAKNIPNEAISKKFYLKCLLNS